MCEKHRTRIDIQMKWNKLTKTFIMFKSFGILVYIKIKHTNTTLNYTVTLPRQ